MINGGEVIIKEKDHEPRLRQNFQQDEKEFIVFDAWTEVADWQFARDTAYTSFIMPENIVSIGKCAFAHCRNLRKIDIGKNVKYIGKFAFRKDNRPGEMASLAEVINRSLTPQEINKFHFHNTDLSKVTLRVPEQSIAGYKKADGWKYFGSIVTLDETEYPAQSGEFFNMNKTADKKTGNTPCALHIWLGNFKTREELDEYADNSEYEWEYYGHLLGEDNFDEPPEEYGLGCAFCWDNGIQYEEAADITDNLFWDFYERKKDLAEILSGLPVDHAEALEACREKHPRLEKTNSYIVLFGYPKKQKDFEKAELSKPCYYLGEFEIPEDDTDAQYEAWV